MAAAEDLRFEEAARIRDELKELRRDLEALRAFYTFRDFAHFIEVYLAVVGLIRDAEDVRLLTYEVAAEMASQNIRYAELTCTPYTSAMYRAAASRSAAVPTDGG